MRYTGNICDGCKKPFTDTDDVVVCPECATPQHRECYDERGCCVNEHLHSEGFTWNSTAQPSVATEDTPKERTITCPNCSAQNPSGSEACENCGMKFVVFGKNLVEIMENLEAENGNTKNQNSAQASQEDDGFRGPYPPDDRTFGRKTNTLGVFMRGNADYYIRKFKKKESGGSLGFNFAAFFFWPYWFFYRKLYKPGIIFTTINLCVTLFMTPSALNFMDFAENTLPNLNPDDMVAMEAAVESIMNDMTLIMLSSLVLLVVRIVAGFMANGYYLRYTLSATNRIGTTAKTREERIGFFAKFGGVSWPAVLLCYCAGNLLLSIAGSLM